MLKSIKIWKKMTFVASQAMLLVYSGSCLPDNTFADTAGNLVSGIITAGVNMLLSGSNLQV